MVALIGDAELDEGNIFECMLEGWKQGLRNCWWIVDYNRQSLDAVIREGLWQRYEQLFRNFGWDVVILKYGSLLEAAFPRAGRRQACGNGSITARTSFTPPWCFRAARPGASTSMTISAIKGRSRKLIESRSDDELARLMTNLAGHDLPSLLEAFGGIDHDRPVCFICYTIKGYGLPFAGHKDNHAGLMTPAQMETFRQAMNIRAGHEWDRFEGLRQKPEALQSFLDDVPFAAGGPRRLTAPRFAAPDELAVTIQPEMSTQTGFGALLNELAREKSELVARIVTTSPDVTVSTNLGAWVNRRGLFARAGAGRHVQKRAHPVHVQLGFFRQGPAHRTRHCRE